MRVRVMDYNRMWASVKPTPRVRAAASLDLRAIDPNFSPHTFE